MHQNIVDADLRKNEDAIKENEADYVLHMLLHLIT